MSRVSGIAAMKADSSVGVTDIPRVFFTPGKVFARVEDVSAWTWPLVILLTLVTLMGWATVQTGLIDRQVDLQVRERIAQIDEQQRDVVARSELRELYEREYQTGEFWKLLARIQVVAAEPAKALATALLVAAVLYGVVALTGRKPEWNALLTICVFAGFVEVLRMAVVLGLMLSFRTLHVDTSLAPLMRLWVEPAQVTVEQLPQLAATAGLLSAVDPFRMWYWALLFVGVRATRQLGGWRAGLVCGLGWLLAASGRAMVAAGSASGAAMSSGGA